MTIFYFNLYIRYIGFVNNRGFLDNGKRTFEFTKVHAKRQIVGC